MNGILKSVDHAGDIDLTDWDFFGFGELDPIIAKAVTQAIKSTFETEQPDAYLPFIWGNSDGIDGGPTSPLTIYIGFVLGKWENGNDGRIFWHLDLNELFDDVREKMDGSWASVEEDAALLKKLAAALRDQAERCETCAENVGKT